MGPSQRLCLPLQMVLSDHRIALFLYVEKTSIQILEHKTIPTGASSGRLSFEMN
jgi:hypothetical protein